MWRAPGVPGAARPPKTSDRPTAPALARRAPADRKRPMTDVTDATEVPETVTEPVRVESFSDFPIHADIVDALAEHKITSPFPIQAMTLPVALAGHDIIGQAKTGTGKTLGFGVPILNGLVAPHDEGYQALTRPGKPQALVVVPTRELAVQVAGDLERAGKNRGIRVLTVYGG